MRKKPLYQQIVEQICDEIKQQEANTAIPSEREMEKKYDVSRMTIRKAVEMLVDEGILYRVQNVGTFVTDRQLRKKTSWISSFINNEEYKVIYFDVKSGDRDINQILNMREGDKYIRIVRVNYNQENPDSIEEIYIPRMQSTHKKTIDVRKILQLEDESLLGGINQKFIPTVVPVYYANLLQIKIGEPILCMETKIFTKQGCIYAFIRAYVHPKNRTIEITI